MSDNTNRAKTLAGVKNGDQLAEVHSALTRPNFESAVEYSRSVYRIAAETQGELGKLICEQAADFNSTMLSLLDKTVSSAPLNDLAAAAIRTAMAAASSAYDTIERTARQGIEVVEDSAASAAASGKRKS